MDSRRYWFGRALLALLAATLLLPAAACTRRSSRDGVDHAPTKTSWDAVLDQIQDDGSVTTATALAAFAVAIGPVPGAVVPAGPREQLDSGTLAVTWILGHWADLNAAQRSAVLAGLQATSTDKPAAYREPTPTPSPSASADPNLGCLTQDSAGGGQFRAMMPGIVSAISGKLGRSLQRITGGPILTLNTKGQKDTSAGDPALMYATPCRDPGGTLIGCTIHINPVAVDGSRTTEMLRTILIHETMHCFIQDRFYPATNHLPAWYIEGAPTWAQTVLGTTIDDRLPKHWLRYLDKPQAPLSTRSYDAVGFFAHLAETGTDPWGRIDEIGDALVRSNTTASGFAAAEASPFFLESWGSGYVRGRHPGRAWTTGGPGLPAYTPPLPNVAVRNGSSLSLTSPAFAAYAGQVDVDATVLQLNPGAGTTGLLTLTGSTDTTVDSHGPYCTAAACACPAGSPRAGTTFAHLDSGQQFVGFTGGAKPGLLVLIGMSLPDFCGKAAAVCVVGRWTSVSLRSSDGAGNVPGSQSGGSGVTLHIGATGTVQVDFAGMQPLVIRDGDVGVSHTYSGSAATVIQLPAANETSGEWVIVGPSTSPGVFLTVQPLDHNLPPIGPIKLTGPGGQSGQGTPLGKRWTCTGDTLTITTTIPDVDAVTVWTFSRTGPD